LKQKNNPLKNYRTLEKVEIQQQIAIHDPKVRPINHHSLYCRTWSTNMNIMDHERGQHIQVPL